MYRVCVSRHSCGLSFHSRLTSSRYLSGTGLFAYFLIWLLGCNYDRERFEKESGAIRSELDRIINHEGNDASFSLTRLHEQYKSAYEEQRKVFVPAMYVIFVAGILLSFVSTATQRYLSNLIFMVSASFISATIVFGTVAYKVVKKRIARVLTSVQTNPHARDR